MNPTDGDALQAQDLVTQLGQHAADFAILAFIQDDSQPGAFALVFYPVRLASLHVTLAQPDAFEQALQIFRRGMTGHLDEIRLIDSEARMHQAIGEIPVVGHK